MQFLLMWQLVHLMSEFKGTICDIPGNSNYTIHLYIEQLHLNIQVFLSIATITFPFLLLLLYIFLEFEIVHHIFIKYRKLASLISFRKVTHNSRIGCITENLQSKLNTLFIITWI